MVRLAAEGAGKIKSYKSLVGQSSPQLDGGSKLGGQVNSSESLVVSGTAKLGDRCLDVDPNLLPQVFFHLTEV